MKASETIRSARRRGGWSLRELGERAGTSHSTLAAYEAGRVVPSVDTLDRVVRAAGFALDAGLEARAHDPAGASRGDELVAVLELAEVFPARHAPTLQAPIFPGRSRAR
jgi:transcriptional regulator with XRE-family HTH domain